MRDYIVHLPAIDRLCRWSLFILQPERNQCTTFQLLRIIAVTVKACTVCAARTLGVKLCSNSKYCGKLQQLHCLGEHS